MRYKQVLGFGPMLPLVMSLLLAQAGPTVGTRAPVAMHVVGAPAPVMFDAARRTLEPITTLTVVPATELGATKPGLERCARDATIVCWLLEMRPDYRSLSGPSVFEQPWADHEKNLKDSGRPYAHYLVLVTVLPDPSGPSRLTTLFVDANRALEIYHRARRDEDGWLERVETEIFAKAVQTELGAIDLGDAAAVERYFGTLWEGRRWIFEPRSQWQPNGAVAVTTNVPGLEVRIDGAVVGTSASEGLEISGVRVGTHEVEVVDPNQRYEPFKSTVAVEERGTAQVQVTVAPATSASSSIRTITGWSGVGLAVAGAALVTVALTADSSVRQLNGGRRFLTFGELGSADGPFPAEPGGPLVAPLGYSLVLTGAIWSAGAWLIGDDWDAPWWQIAVGIAAGLTSYTVSALAN